jgi:hypothetical protein
MDDGLLVFLIIVGSILFIALIVYISGKFADIAEMKGHDRMDYFWPCLLLGFIGWMMVIALPDRGNPTEIGNDNTCKNSKRKSNTIASEELPDL